MHTRCMDDVMFRQWMRKVDAIFYAKVGLGHSDLPDAPWADYFSDELTPSQAFDNYIEDGWDDGMFEGLV